MIRKTYTARPDWPCLVGGCPEPRYVTPSGYAYARCERHKKDLGCAAEKARRQSDPEAARAAARARRWADIEKSRERERTYSRDTFYPRKKLSDPEFFQRRGRKDYARHSEARLATARDYRARDPEKWRAYNRATRAEDPERHRKYGRDEWAKNPEKYREGARRKAHIRRIRLAGVPPYTRIDPWPTECQCSHEAIDLSLSRRDPMGETIGHEPPICWLERHPEYDGPRIERPEHLSCNMHKHQKPDWEL